MAPEIPPLMAKAMKNFHFFWNPSLIDTLLLLAILPALQEFVPPGH